MNDKVVDFQAGKENQLDKRREAKLDVMRQAFRLARGETGKGGSQSTSAKKKRRKSKK